MQSLSRTLHPPSLPAIAERGACGGAYNYRHSPQGHGIVQELCESRGGRPGLSVLTSILVSVDVKNY